MSADQRCDGMVALVTGSSRGLGKAIAARLAAQGATVALTARTMDPDPKYQGSLSQTLDEIVAAGGRAVAVQADLSKAEERERLFAEVVSAVGAPDILVNNAAVTFLRPLDGFPDRRARLMMEMHVLGPTASESVGDSRDARAWTGLDSEPDLGGRRPATRAAVLRIRPDRGLRHLRDGQGRAQPADEKPCRRTV